jgi:hypothetical protein
MDEQSRRSRLRTFALGSVVGAAGAIAAVRRLRHPVASSRSAPAGLAAFEDAPCFIELIEREAQSYRAGGEIGAERNE